MQKTNTLLIHRDDPDQITAQGIFAYFRRFNVFISAGARNNWISPFFVFSRTRFCCSHVRSKPKR